MGKSMSKTYPSADWHKAKAGSLVRMGDPGLRYDDSPSNTSSTLLPQSVPDALPRASDSHPLSPPLSCRAITKTIRLTLGNHHLAELAPKRCFLLELPPELLSHIVNFVIAPKNNRLHLLCREKHTILRFAGPGSSVLNSGTEAGYKPYLPPVLFASRLLNATVATVLRRDVVLQITVGHELAADVTLKSRYSLRAREVMAFKFNTGVLKHAEQSEVDRENKKLARERRQIKRLRATLESARGFRKVVITLDHHDKHAKTMAYQLEEVLGHLAVGSISGRKGFQLDKNYVVINMQDWMKFLRPHLFWNGRIGPAAKVLEVMSKYRNIDGFGERMIVDVRLAQGFQAVKRGPRKQVEIDIGYADMVSTCNTGPGKLPGLFARFLREFRRRQLRGGSVAWDVKEDDIGQAIFDDDEDADVGFDDDVDDRGVE